MVQFDKAFATVTGKGRMTIPKDVRVAANRKPGDRIQFTVLDDGTIIVRVKNRSIRDVSFKPARNKRASIAQMTRQTKSDATSTQCGRLGATGGSLLCSQPFDFRVALLPRLP
jgi:AbrB family looped-hinge helix DNA binding protein